MTPTRPECYAMTAMQAAAQILFEVSSNMALTQRRPEEEQQAKITVMIMWKRWNAMPGPIK